MIKRYAIILMLGLFLFFGPSICLQATHDLKKPSDANPAAAALIFGAVVRNGQINPLHKERLDTGIDLWKSGKVSTIVVSNAPSAAIVMNDYLIENGIPTTAIEVDTQAIRTPDTCRFEKAKGAPRPVIFVSQKFHLPRIALQCAKYNIDSQLVFADKPEERVKLPLATTLRIRIGRTCREAFLTWGAILGIYPEG